MVHSLTLSYTPGSMKCGSRPSLLARTFASPCLGHEPKARVATKRNLMSWVFIPHKLSIITLALGSRPSQGLVRVQAKREARESHLMFPRM